MNPISTLFPRLLLVIIFSQFTQLAFCQKIFTSTINTTGESKKLSQQDPRFAGFSFEWNVGESAAVTSMQSDQLLLTNGLLQYRFEQMLENNRVATFLADEVKVGPNPLKDQVEINILNGLKGKLIIELVDNKGNKLKQVQLQYNGIGVFEKWNLSGLTAGQYFISIRQLHPVTGRITKSISYPIVKMN
ncbi:MAG: hypothetical protein EBZ95_01980 [Chitinophagia bacterium]|nr:hypothetical protein [Chitinophagia bacterium]